MFNTIYMRKESANVPLILELMGKMVLVVTEEITNIRLQVCDAENFYQCHSDHLFI